MATIKAIEAKSVHQIQSGQVIVDLCSVVKELVENSLDAGATSIEVRFKNNGLDSIEVQDNGAGIAPSNYPNVALKHYTSKISNYDDLSTLQTFGFRGEALSSLCALSHFFITTAQAGEAPKGNRLEFEVSGVLKSTTTSACQRGTIAVVGSLFETLPVRRKELSKNIKREYGKVLGLLHAYACIGVNVKFTVKNAMPKGKTSVVFSTKGNANTRENIANVYGAKTLQALAPLDLDLEFQPTLTQMARSEAHITNVKVVGHISRPIFGEGRQAPDRQMFFVNGRPCGLPQIAKAVNEVYKSFNTSQSPFIFADFAMDTNAYDVNVSPDKRSIMLHNATTLIERLKNCLTEMFDKHEQTVPLSQAPAGKLPAFKQLSVQRQTSADSSPSEQFRGSSVASNGSSRLRDDSTRLDDADASDQEHGTKKLFHDHFRAQASTRQEVDPEKQGKLEAKVQKDRERRAGQIADAMAKQAETARCLDEYDDVREMQQDEASDPQAIRVRDFNARMAEQQKSKAVDRETPGASSDQAPNPITDDRSEPEQPRAEEPIVVITPTVKESPGIVQTAFDRMRSKRMNAETAIITIDGETTTAVIGSQVPGALPHRRQPKKSSKLSLFSQSLQKFGAPGPQAVEEDIGTLTESESGGSSLNGEVPERALDVTEPSAEGAESWPSLNQEELENDAADVADMDYFDEAEKKVQEDARVAELIRQAEEGAAMPSKDNIRRVNRALKGGQSRDSSVGLLTSIETSLDQLRSQMESLRTAMQVGQRSELKSEKEVPTVKDEEMRLSLTVSKNDFARMDIVGQFNLGFILAVRPKSVEDEGGSHDNDELFIIDQHASDEKFNFERLQAETVIGNQRMVRPVNLSLTAVEEEILLENAAAFEKNGFIVEIDTTGASPIGGRCTLTSLPLSRETTFDTRDMDELIHMLSEAPMIGTASTVPRPSRVRKMFAMRACRSSIMIGKTLSAKQMQTVLAHMGTVDKPWNCPHGRPTMRHLTSLDNIGTWQEGDAIADTANRERGSRDTWNGYIQA